MKWSARLQSFPIVRFTFIRFGLVALLGESVYFILYGLMVKLTNHLPTSLAIAGGICIVLNAYTHSRITFRVNFTWRLLFGYLQIQLLGFALAFLLGLFLERLGTNKWMIALLTYASWAIISYLLSKVLYRSEGRKTRPSQLHP